MKKYKSQAFEFYTDLLKWLNTVQPEVVSINYVPGDAFWIITYIVEEETLKVPDWIKEHNRENEF